MGLGGPDTDPIATISSPLSWFVDADSDSDFSTVSIVDETIVVTSGRNTHSVGPSGQSLVYEPFDSPVSDIRVWESGRSNSMAVVVPREHRIVISKTSVSSQRAE